MRSGAVVRAPASHQCGPVSNPGVDAIDVCGLSLLLVLVLAPRSFSPCISFFPLLKKKTLPNSISISNARTRFDDFLRTPKCSVGKEMSSYNFFYWYLIYTRAHPCTQAFVFGNLECLWNLKKRLCL